MLFQDQEEQLIMQSLIIWEAESALTGYVIYNGKTPARLSVVGRRIRGKGHACSALILRQNSDLHVYKSGHQVTLSSQSPLLPPPPPHPPPQKCKKKETECLAWHRLGGLVVKRQVTSR